MKSSVIQLIVLTSAFSALGLTSHTIPHTVTAECPSAQELTSSILSVDGHKIVSQVFSCPEGNFTSAAISRSDLSFSQARPILGARSQSECTTPTPECQCGVTFGCGCFVENTAPLASDCSTLIGSTAVIASIQGPTFIVQPNQIRAITLRTCTLGFVNLASTPTEFCWDDLAGTADDVLECISDAGRDDPIGNGICLSTNQRFATRLGLSQ